MTALVLTVAVAASGAASPTPTYAAPVAVPNAQTMLAAWNVIDGVGVNVHMNYNDTSYADTALVKGKLRQLGVHHVRDGVNATVTRGIEQLKLLGKSGQKLTLLTGGPSPARTSVDPAQTAALTQLAPYLAGLEQPNEYDCAGDPSWSNTLSQFTASQAQAIRQTPSMANVPVIGPSFCQPANVARFAAPAGSYSVANLHDYSREATPELALEGRVPQAQASQGGLPLQITESGFSNALNAPGEPVFSEQAAADYTVRLVLDALSLGVQRTFLYELLDEKPDPSLSDYEQHFGLVRRDGTNKPAFNALRNLLRDVARTDPFSVAPPASLPGQNPVSITGGGSLLRSLAIADPSGTGFTMAVWLAQPSTSPISASVHLAVPGTYAVTTQRPSRGNKVVDVGLRRGLTLSVDGAVTLVHFDPAAGNAQQDQPPQPTAAGWIQQNGAVTTSYLSASDPGWGGEPGADASLPNNLPTGVKITDASQVLHVPVPLAPTKWTITIWAKTDPSSDNFAGFLRATGLRGGVLRTYDLTGDVPSHMQLSAYGLPLPGAPWGTEMFSQALTGRWNLLSLSFNGRTATFGVNGVLTSTASTASALTGIDVGALSGGYRGSLGALAVFPRVLTSSQLVTLATRSDS